MSSVERGDLVTRLGPKLEELERHRQAGQANAQRYMGAIAVVGIIIALVLVQASGAWFLALPVLAGTVAAAIASWNYALSDYRHNFTYEVISSILADTHPELSYRPAQGMPESAYDASGLFSSADRYSTEDGFGGRIGVTDVRFSEVHAEDRSTDSEGRTTYSTIFKGLFFEADFHKHFSGSTRVMPDMMERAFGRFGRHFQGLRPLSSEQLVHMEDPQFEKLFKVVSTDQVEARYILTPAMLQRIVRLQHKWNDRLSLSFRNSSVFVAIQRDVDMFEANASAKATDPAQLRHLAAEIDWCCSLIDDLDLNTRIWTK